MNYILKFLICWIFIFVQFKIFSNFSRLFLLSMDHLKVYCLISKYLETVDFWFNFFALREHTLYDLIFLHLLRFVLRLKFMVGFSLVNFPSTWRKEFYSVVQFYHKDQISWSSWLVLVLFSYFITSLFFSIVTERGVLKSPIAIVKLSFSFQFCQFPSFQSVYVWSIDS